MVATVSTVRPTVTDPTVNDVGRISTNEKIATAFLATVMKQVKKMNSAKTKRENAVDEELSSMLI